jgi:hypothetical protein
MRTFDQWLQLTDDAIERINWAKEKGIMSNDETPQKVQERVQQLEVQEYCTVNGGVLFDIDDLEVL